MAEEASLQLVRQHMRAVRTPGHHDKVFKDECMFSFATPLAPEGLYINLSSWQAFGAAWVQLDHERSGNALYLCEKWHQVPLSEEEQKEKSSKPEKMSIGGEGGFQVDAPEHKTEKERALVIMPGRQRVALPCADLPEVVLQAISAVVAHDSASKQEEVAVWEDERRESKYARDLVQLPADHAVPSDPSQWVCQETGATENLWLNLSSGFIGSGRQQWGGTGGSGAALGHFEATGLQFPLAVKLGTITPHGADVYSYAADEDDMVQDPLLAQHLAHWGINILQMEKTEKTMAELEIDQNVKFEWDKILEASAELQPLSGPGYVGLTNLGNSCYMNSVLQMLWMLPQLKARYAGRADHLFRTAPLNPVEDFPTQMAKLGRALVNGVTGNQQEGSAVESSDSGSVVVTEAVKPQFFKALVGKGHPEFSSPRQQDALEFFQHMLELVTRAERSAGDRLESDTTSGSAADAFAFQLEDRKQDVATGKVRYRRYAEGPPLGLSIPLEAATNKGELEDYKDREGKRQKLVDESAGAYICAPSDGGSSFAVTASTTEEPVKPTVPFAACLEKWAAPELLEGVDGGPGGTKRTMIKQSRFATFPPFLLIQMRRYYTGEGWVPKKMDVLVEAPDKLSLEHLRSTGLQPDEVEDPEAEAVEAISTTAAAAAPAVVEPDPLIVAQLMSMGFGENGSKRAAVATQNAGTEVSMEWVLAHMEDPDFNNPLPEPSAAVGSGGGGEDSSPGADPEAVAMLSSMGFTDVQASAALKACSGSMERAVDWLFSHSDDLNAADDAINDVGAAVASQGGGPAAAAKLDDGVGEYTLVGFVSHMGANTACGHYVAHIKKDGRWVIFNDEKVAASAKPPKALGYLYMYRRNDFVDK